MSATGDVARRKLLLWMGGAAGGSLLLGASSFLPPPASLPRAETGRLVLPAFADKAGAVTLVSVETAEESYRIVRAAGGWAMAEKGGYPVAPTRLRQLFEALAGMRYGQAMTRDDRKFDRIGLGDPGAGGAGALLQVGDDEGAIFARLLVGRREGRTYIRQPDDLQAWSVDPPAFPPLQRAIGWLDLNVAPVAAGDILSVMVRPASGAAYLVARSVDGGFALARPAVKGVVAPLGPQRVAEVMSRFAPVDVAPAREASAQKLVGEHVTSLRNGLALVARCTRDARRGWVTLSAAASEGASAETLAQAAAINARSAPWAFGVSEFEWQAFTMPLAELAG